MTEVEEAKTKTGKEKPDGAEDKAPATPRSAGVTSDPSGPDSPVSIRKHATAPDEPPPPSMSRKEREDIAKKRVGATLKGWRLARLLGVGPICAAYESFRGADDSGEHVVLKLMIGNIAKHERARAMFLRGAYASNRFTHPRVVSVSADGTDAEDTPFVVRPWVDAQTLEQVVTRSETGIEQAQVLRIAEQVLDALEIAHSHGIVHGAITPRNILVTPRGSARLCDFSVPPGMGPRTSDEEDVLAARRVGPFSAPERCGEKPKAASEQTDLYMIAACLYYAISKEMPRGNADTPDVLRRTPARPVRTVAPKVSEHLAQVIDHALSLAPEARFESAYAMLGDVRRAMAGRRPKLGDARRPVPSGSFSALPLSTRDGPSSSSRLGTTTLRNDYPPSGRSEGRQQWKGNVALILAIALLVGVATFVMVREKVEESRAQEQEELLRKQKKDESAKPKPDDLAAPPDTSGTSP